VRRESQEYQESLYLEIRGKKVNRALKENR